jgi:light-harvesting protein B-800-850 alpha chain
MNQGKIWRVVQPTVGVPLFLAAVAATSLFVHYQLLTKTTWLPSYYQGGAKAAKTAEANVETSTKTAQAESPTAKQ